MKRIFMLCAILFMLISYSSYALAQDVHDYEITLPLSVGDRSGTFTGTLQNGLPEGQGIFEFHSPQGILWRYEGEFHAGQFHGFGDALAEDGDRFVGEFYNSRLHGEGRMYVGGEIWGWGVFVDGELWNGSRIISPFGEFQVTEGQTDGVRFTAILVGLILVGLFAFVFVIYCIRRSIKLVKLAREHSTSSITCKNCGALNPPEQQLCITCGTRL